MGTTRLGIFPSLNNKVMYDIIDRGLLAWIMGRWPIDFFTHAFIDNQSSVANNYKLNKNGELVPVDTAQVLATPNVRMTVRHGVNNQSDVFGSDIWNPSQQPGAFAVDTDLSGYRPIYHDPFNVIIALNERTVKVNFDITFTLQTKSDQIGFMNYLDTFLKMNYVQTIDIPTVIPVHNMMMSYIRSCLFKPEILALDKSIDGSDEQNKFKKYINQMFMEMMYEHSNHNIKPYQEVKSADTQEDLMNYTYCYNQVNRLFVKFEKYDADEGNKKNNAYDSFTVTVSGNYDFGIPISFITSVPAIIRGTRNNWYLKTGENKSDDLYYQMLQFKEVFKDNRHLIAVNPNLWRHFYYEKEILMSSKVEKFNILDDVITLKESPSHYYIMKALLKTIKTQEDFNGLFKTVIYKNDEPINDKLVKIDKEFNITINNCDLTVPYYIDVFINAGEFQNRMNEIRTQLENEGINWWNYFDKIVEEQSKSNKSNGTWNLSWFVDSIKDDFRGYLTGESGKTNNTKKNNYRYTLNPYEGNSHVDRGYRGIGYVPHYKIEESTELTFLPIVSSQFLTVDNQFEYYFKNADNKYIKIEETSDAEDMIIADKRSIYIKVAKKYVECDKNKVLVPDPKYKYYILDKRKNAYVYQEGIDKFDPIQQYYILKDEYRYNVPDPEVWN